MVRNGSVSLQQVADRLAQLNVACSRCDRKGRYSTARLVQQYGPEFAMTDLKNELTNCPMRDANGYQRCDVFFPGLGEAFSAV